MGPASPPMGQPWPDGFCITAAAGTTPDTPTSQQAFPGQGPIYHCELRATASRTGLLHEQFHVCQPFTLGSPTAPSGDRPAAWPRPCGAVHKDPLQTRPRGVKPEATGLPLPSCQPASPSRPLCPRSLTMLPRMGTQGSPGQRLALTAAEAEEQH